MFFSSINGHRLPHLADEIIDRTFHRVSCGQCGLRFEQDRQLLYFHTVRGELVLKLPFALRAEYERLEREIDATFLARVREQAPAAISARVGEVKRRIVFTMDQMSQTLYLWRLGFDDGLVECLKLALLRERLAEWMPLGPVELCFESLVDEGRTMAFGLFRMGDWARVGGASVSVEMYRAIAASPALYRERMPRLFDGLFVNATRALL